MARSLNKPAGFDDRLQYSIRLLRKAQKLALTYDGDDGFFLAFSGGKDSQALYHVAKLAGVRFRAHMNFTSVDPPQVIRFVRTCYPDVITHAPVKSIFALAVDRGILPSMRIRWCCADLKESAGAGKVTLIGIRKQESTRRAKRHEIEVSNKQFSGDFDQFKKWQRKTISAKEAALLRRMKREGKKVNEDYFSVNQQDQVRCINGQDSILISPIFNWTEKDVWYFLNEVVHVPHCELYDQGYHRIGCILCPMSSPRQKQREMQDFPHVRRGWLNAIKQIRAGGVLSSEPTSQITPPPMRPIRHDTALWSLYFTGGTERSTPVSGRLAPISQSPVLDGFSPSPSHSGVRGGQNEPSEDEIAEKIFSWWISGKSYKKWYADTYLQLKFDFEYE